MEMTIRHLTGTTTTISYIPAVGDYDIECSGSDGVWTCSIAVPRSVTWLELARRFAQVGDRIEMDDVDYGAFDLDSCAVPDTTAEQMERP